MKIHIVHCGRSPSPWTHQFDALHAAFRSASPALHALTDDPAEADHIFITNAEQPGGNFAASHPLLHRYPEKCLLLSEQWKPPFLLAGIYANAPRTFGRGRFRSGSYFLHHPDFQNPFVLAHQPTDNLPPERRDLLFTFLGRGGHPIRTQMFGMRFQREDVLVQDTSKFDMFSHEKADKSEAQARYYQICLRSKYIVCPRGCGSSSIRLFEALRLGIAPVIISDAWVPCEGPDWRSCALFVPERDVGDIEKIIASAESEYLARGRAARQIHEQFFAADKYFNFLVTNASSIRARRRIPESLFVRALPLRLKLDHWGGRIRSAFSRH